MQRSFVALAGMFGTEGAMRTATAIAWQRSISVTTYQNFFAPPEAVWEGLMFYEEVAEVPSFWLRRFLPVPISTEGCKSQVGAKVICRYVGGHLLKRVTQIIQGQKYAFDVIEQDLALGGIRLLGGDYTLYKLSERRTRVALATHYESPNQPRWLCGRFETLVCHSFHRHILTGMESNLPPH